MYIDTHAHLDFPELRPHLEEVLNNAQLAGVNFINTIGIDGATNRNAVKIAEEHEGVYASVGWHPHDAAQADASLEDHIRSLASHPKVVAIGEIGLDYYRNLSPPEKQRDVFARLIRTAAELDLPVIVHCRDAYDDTFRIIEENRMDNTRGVFHCFSGGVAELKRALDLGFFISYTGNITYKNSRLLPTVQATPIDRTLLETDCPFLTPHPHRGKRNEPAYVPLIAAKLAQIKGLTKEDIARVTNYNAYHLFGIGKAPEKEIVYGIRSSLYIALTTRCTNKCVFCPRLTHPVVKGHNIGMKREEEPHPDQIMSIIGDPSRHAEIVFCGFGEPTLRLEVLLETARRLKSRGARRLRLDTNGQGNLIHNRDIVPELAVFFDAVSISLNASDARQYQQICRSNFGEDAFPAILDFARRCVAQIPDVTLTAVGYPGVDSESCRALAEEIGAKFRLREYNEVG